MTSLPLHYQPQAKIDGEVFGFEALLRWTHPKRGLVPPATFIPLAEQNGMIAEIGEWTLRQACREAASWPSAVAGRRQSVAGPVPPWRSGRAWCIRSSWTPAWRPGAFELEITEGVLINDPPRALAILRRLKLLGVKIAMDDFGTGYASLSSLAVVPLRQAQDRQDLRVRRGVQSPVGGDRACRDRPRQGAEDSGDRRRRRDRGRAGRS